MLLEAGDRAEGEGLHPDLQAALPAILECLPGRLPHIGIQWHHLVEKKAGIAEGMGKSDGHVPDAKPLAEPHRAGESLGVLKNNVYLRPYIDV